MAHPEIDWLPDAKDTRRRLRAVRELPPAEAWSALVALARTRLDFLTTAQVDRALAQVTGQETADSQSVPECRLALLSSSTVDHLLPSLRIAALRRGIRLHVYAPDYGQYRQELYDAASGLHRFKPDTVLFAMDWRHLLGDDPTVADCVSRAAEDLKGLWRMARNQFGGQVIQQTLLDTAPALMGQNEHRLAHSPRTLIADLNTRLRAAADETSVDLLALDAFSSFDGLLAWHDPRLWYHGKQEIAPPAAPMWGDLVMRLVAARMGRSAKCLVLDLDNTLWGGVVGDDGVEGIVLGQGSALGEAFQDFQSWLCGLSRRGVILAVCSKNDEANALAPFERHPEMILKHSDIACFLANWDDKPANIRRIASLLNIGLDSLVFVDDNAFERDIVRRELPEVAVPDMPDDPSLYAACLARAGYFESLRLSVEDTQRTAQYQANIERQKANASTTDVEGFLAGLDMRLVWSPFDELNRVRVTQLINKTNQFNLTTRRYTDEQVHALMGDPSVLGLHFRLLDRFGDNGIIGIIIAREAEAPAALVIDSWLMSCRVLGRKVEQAMLNLLVEQACKRNMHTLVGEYRATPRNEMVREHYPRLGFVPHSGAGDSWMLAVSGFTPFTVPMVMRKA